MRTYAEISVEKNPANGFGQFIDNLLSSAFFYLLNVIFNGSMRKSVCIQTYSVWENQSNAFIAA